MIVAKKALADRGGAGGIDVEVVPARSGVTGYSAWRCRGGEASSPLTYRVLEGGEGPPVVLMHELMGAGPTQTTVLAWTLRDAGYRVWLPVFFEPGAEDVGLLRGVAKICIRREFHTLASTGQTALTAWLHDLLACAVGEGFSNDSAQAAEEVGVIGMCMTGGLVFAQLAHPRVGAAVAVQRSLPLAPDLPLLGARGAEDLGLNARERHDAVVTTTPLLAMRFQRDRICASKRMDAVCATFGTAPCEVIESDEVLRVEQCGRLSIVEAFGSSHATLTYDAPKAQGRTVDQVPSFLRKHLLTGEDTDHS